MFGMARSVDPMLEGASSEGTEAYPQGVDDDDVLLFVNEWLAAIADHTIGLVVVQLCQVRCSRVWRHM